MEDTDEVLIEKIRAGDRVAFQQLVQRHMRKVYAIAYDITLNHYDAEDISQQAFLRVYEALKDFRGEARFSSWLYRIVVNLCINLRRRAYRRSHDPLEEEILQRADVSYKTGGHQSQDPERALYLSEINVHIQRALDHLPRKQRTVFVLKHYHDFTIREISQITQSAEGTVKIRLFRAIRKLRKLLEFYREEIGLDEGL